MYDQFYLNNSHQNGSRQKRTSSVSDYSVAKHLMSNQSNQKQHYNDDSSQYHLSTCPDHFLQNTVECSKLDEFNKQTPFSFNNLAKNSSIPRVHPFIKSKQEGKGLLYNEHSLLSAFSPVLSVLGPDEFQRTPQSKTIIQGEQNEKFQLEGSNYNQNLMSILNNIKLVNHNITSPEQKQHEQRMQLQSELKIDIIAGIEAELQKLKQILVQEQSQPQSFYRQTYNEQADPQEKLKSNAHSRKSSREFTFTPKQTQTNIPPDYNFSALEEKQKENNCLEAKLIQMKFVSDSLKQQLQEEEKKHKQIKQEQDEKIAQLELQKYQIQIKFNDKLEQIHKQDSPQNLEDNTLAQLKDQELKLLQNKFNDLNDENIQLKHSLRSLEREFVQRNQKIAEQQQELTEWKIKYQNLNQQVQILPNYTVELRYSNQKISDLDARVKELVNQNEYLKLQNANLDIECKKYVELKALHKQTVNERDQLKSDNAILKNIQHQFQDYMDDVSKSKERLYYYSSNNTSIDHSNKQINDSFKELNGYYEEVDSIKRASKQSSTHQIREQENNEESNHENCDEQGEGEKVDYIKQIESLKEQIIQQEQIIEQLSFNLQQKEESMRNSVQEKQQTVNPEAVKENSEEGQMDLQSVPQQNFEEDDNQLNELEQLKNQIVLSNQQNKEQLELLQTQLEEYKIKHSQLQKDYQHQQQDVEQNTVQNPENLSPDNQNEGDLKKQVEELNGIIEEYEKEKASNKKLILNLNEQMSQFETIVLEKNNTLEESFSDKMHLLSDITQLREREKLLLKGNENLQSMYSQMRNEFENMCIQDRLNQESIKFYKKQTEKTQSKYLKCKLSIEQLSAKLEQCTKSAQSDGTEQQDSETSSAQDITSVKEEVLQKEYQIQQLQEQISLKDSEKDILCKEIRLLNQRIIDQDSQMKDQTNNIELVESKNHSEHLSDQCQCALMKVESQDLIENKEVHQQSTDGVAVESDQKNIMITSKNQESQIKQLKQLVQNGRNEIEKLYEILNTRKEEYDKLKECYDQKLVEYESMMNQNNDLTTELDVFKEQEKQKSQEMQEISTQKAKFQQQADKYFLELVKKNKELIETNELINIIKAKYEDALQTIQSLESKIQLQNSTESNQVNNE